MEKHSFWIVTLFSLFFISASYGQSTFAPIGAAWWHSGAAQNYYPYYWLSHGLSEKDTVIGGISCRKIITQKRWQNRYTAADSGRKWDPPLFVYNNDDTVFAYNKYFGRFTPLYIFNANIGDTICLPVLPDDDPDLQLHPLTGDSSFCFVVDSINAKLYDNEPLKTFYTHAIVAKNGNVILDSFPHYNWGNPLIPASLAGAYARVIGGSYGLLPYRLSSVSDYMDEVYGPSGKLRCYSDSNFDIHMEHVPCDTFIYEVLVGIGEQKTEKIAVTVFPNPAAATVTIKSSKVQPDDIYINLTDLMGRRLSTYMLPRGEQQTRIDISTLPAGIYLLRLQAGQLSDHYKILVQH